MMHQQPQAKLQQDITTIVEFYMTAKEVQRRLGQIISATSTKNCQFGEFDLLLFIIKHQQHKSPVF